MRRVFQNLGFLLGGRAAAGVLSLIYVVIAARVLGPGRYGVLVLVHGLAPAIGLRVPNDPFRRAKAGADLRSPRRPVSIAVHSYSTPRETRVGSLQPPFVHDNGWRLRYPAHHVDLARKFRVNAAAGLEAVFEANRPALGRFLRARLRNDDGAEDILQDLWIKLRGLDAGPIAEPLAYLYKMAENLVLDRKRAGGRRTSRETEWTEGQIGGTLQVPADAAPSAERVLIARDYLRRVDARLDALPGRTAFAFRAVRVEGRPQKEIAAELGISVSAVEKHLQRAYRVIVDVRDELNADNDGLRRLTSKGTTDDT